MQTTMLIHFVLVLLSKPPGSFDVPAVRVRYQDDLTMFQLLNDYISQLFFFFCGGGGGGFFLHTRMFC